MFTSSPLENRKSIQCTKSTNHSKHYRKKPFTFNRYNAQAHISNNEYKNILSFTRNNPPVKMVSFTPVYCFLLFFGIAVADNCAISNYDDVANAVKSCSNLVISSMSVPAGKTLTLNLLDGATLTFQGITKFGATNWAGPLVQITGNNIQVYGSDDSMLDGQGAQYWDGLGTSGTTKPVFVKLYQANNAVFNNVKIKNCPVRCVSIGNSDHITLDGWNVDVSAGDANELGHNTDGFDISQSTYVLIQNTNVFNQDDCIAVNQGSHMTFYKMYCSGGHGLSLSVGMSTSNGEANTVEDINFMDSTVVNSRNGIHIKTHNDAGTGEIADVTYSNIRLEGITYYGVNIQEDYANGGSTGNPKNNIVIKNLVFKDITGSVNSNAVGVYILCASGGCTNWSWSNVKITGQKGNDCNYSPSGFSC